MWLIFAFLSASVMGFYDVFKKLALKDNSVMMVLFLTVLTTSLLFAPFIVISRLAPSFLAGSLFFVPETSWEVHGYILIKAIIVLICWLLGYMGMKHLPITLVGPINATRPVMVLVGAMLIFGERLNLWQWIGVVLALVSIFLLSMTSKKEGIKFTHNRWILCVVGAAVLGASSGLYDKHLLMDYSPMLIQSWYSIYQLLMMLPLMWWMNRGKTEKYQIKFSWAIPLIGIFLSIGDFVYFMALKDPQAMVSIVSMIRRGSVLVSFFYGAYIFGEKNLKSKALDLALIFLGMIFLYIGSEA